MSEKRKTKEHRDAKEEERRKARDKFDPTSEAEPDDDSCEHGMSPAYACHECRSKE